MSDLVKELRLMNIDLSHRVADRIEELEAELHAIALFDGKKDERIAELEAAVDELTEDNNKLYNQCEDALVRAERAEKVLKNFINRRKSE